MINLSKTSKMPCKSWSLEAGPTCPGSINKETKEPYPVCANCYAQKGFYRMPNVLKPRQENREGWKDANWVDDMVDLLKGEEYFRWFDSGDCYHPDLACKIESVMRGTPKTKHWMPTKMRGVNKQVDYWQGQMQGLPNVVVRYSEKEIHKESGILSRDDIPSSVVTKKGVGVIDGITGEEAYYCPAPKQEGKCLQCRACWDKDVGLVVYEEH